MNVLNADSYSDLILPTSSATDGESLIAPIPCPEPHISFHAFESVLPPDPKFIDDLSASGRLSGSSPAFLIDGFKYYQAQLDKERDILSAGDLDISSTDRMEEAIKTMLLSLDAYDENLIALAQSLSKNLNIKTVNGVYAGLTGPTLETPAEYSYIRKIGADAVGMSTVPEVIAARHMQIPCFGLSIITELWVPGKIVKVTHQDVQNVGSKPEQNLTRLIKKLLESI